MAKFIEVETGRDTLSINVDHIVYYQAAATGHAMVTLLPNTTFTLNTGYAELRRIVEGALAQ